MHKLILFAYALMLSTVLFDASSAQAQAQGTPPKMNGYTANEFGDFAKNWHLVTVRFRKDTSEMRFTYANDAAWKTLSTNQTDYPDGAVFAKIGVMTKEDPAFPSSATPNGARRIQYMVRNKLKHADTDGWGYALFDNNGQLFPGDQKQATVACAACHRLVPERGFVFSQIMTQPNALTSLNSKSSEHSWLSRIQFAEQDVKTLPKEIRQLLPAHTTQVQVIQGELSAHIFMGTLDEIRPALAQEVLRSKHPALLLSKDAKSFSLVFKIENKNCDTQKGQTALKGIHSLPTPDQSSASNAPTSIQSPTPNYQIEFCQTRD